MAMSMPDSARYYIEHEHRVVPVPFKEKGPTLRGWPDLEITLDTVDLYFNGGPQNIALLMGTPRNLADVDADCPEAYWAGKEYLPPTGLHWGRASNPDSHHLYFTEPAAVTAKYLDPVFEKDNPAKACMVELRCFTKEGKIGNPVVAPPSTHPTGEAYEFTNGIGSPSTVAGDFLDGRVRLIAAASMLGRHAHEGVRHEIFIALAGAFARAKWELEEAQRFLRAIYRVIWHETAKLGQANSDADSTYQRYDDGHETTGLSRLASLIDDRAFKRLKEWLGFEWEGGAARAQLAPKKKPRALPKSDPIEELREKKIVMPQKMIDSFAQVPSVGLLVSPPKVGKTVLAMEIAMSLVNGLHLFENYANHCKKGDAAALFVEWDDIQGEASLKEFLLKCRASRPNQAIRVCTRPKEEFTISDSEFRPWLTEQIRQLDRPYKICVLDSLTALRGFGSDDKSKNVVKLEASEVSMLGEVAMETHCDIRLIHHDSKTAANLDIFSRAAGTYALQACTESQIVLGRFPELPLDDPARLVSVQGRHLRSLQAVLKFREETLDFDFILEGDAARHYVELRQLLRAFRGKRDIDPKKIEEATGWGRSKSYAVLGHLTGAGILSKDAGAWNWNPSLQKTLDQI